MINVIRSDYQSCYQYEARKRKSERIARGRGSKGGGHQPLEALGQAQ
jgi:hypothetical protein